MISTLLFAVSTTAQNRKFLDSLKYLNDIAYQETAPSNQQVDVVHFDPNYYGGIILSVLNSERSKKGKGAFVQDTLFNRIAVAGLKTFSKSRFTDKSKWRKEQKSINYALIKHKSKHKVFDAYAFMVDFMDYSQIGSFYYDPKDQSDTPRLYKGKRSKAKRPDHEDYFEPVPVDMVTEIEFGEQILKMISKHSGTMSLMSKKYTQIGVAVKIDRRTLYRSKRPKGYVIIIFGGKKNQKIKVPYNYQPDTTDNQDL